MDGDGGRATSSRRRSDPSGYGSDIGGVRKGAASVGGGDSMSTGAHVSHGGDDEQHEKSMTHCGSQEQQARVSHASRKDMREPTRVRRLDGAQGELWASVE